MATHTQIGSVQVDAFQWVGGSLGNYALPAWASALPMQTPGDGSLHVPTPRGTFRANVGDWAVRLSTGHIDIMSNNSFTTLYS
jgi:hypothetical protein